MESLSLMSLQNMITCSGVCSCQRWLAIFKAKISLNRIRQSTRSTHRREGIGRGYLNKYSRDAIPTKRRRAKPRGAPNIYMYTLYSEPKPLDSTSHSGKNQRTIISSIQNLNIQSSPSHRRSELFTQTPRAKKSVLILPVQESRWIR